MHLSSPKKLFLNKHTQEHIAPFYIAIDKYMKTRLYEENEHCYTQSSTDILQ